jgi:hypothetical protein
MGNSEHWRLGFDHQTVLGFIVVQFGENEGFKIFTQSILSQPRVASDIIYRGGLRAGNHGFVLTIHHL